MRASIAESPTPRSHRNEQFSILNSQSRPAPMKFILILAALCIWAKLTYGVIINGVINWTPNGAVSYSIWRQNPGSTSPDLQAVVTAPPYAVIGSIADGTIWWLRGNFPLDSGQCCKESDLAFVVTPPTTNNVGTNHLRITGSNSVLKIWSSDFGFATWTNIAEFTGGPPVLLPITGRINVRTTRESKPPFPQ